MKSIIDVSKLENSVEAVDEICTLKEVNSNGLNLSKSSEYDKVSNSSLEESSELIQTYSSNSKTKSNQVSNPDEVSTISDSIPNLPSLDKLDSLSNFTSCTNTTKQNSKKKRFMSKYVKKVQSLLPKS
jgi:hypothetical protein